MNRATFFVQDCPICGRQLEVRLELLGRSAACPHCHGRFEARDGSGIGHDSRGALQVDLMERADALLHMLDRQRPSTR